MHKLRSRLAAIAAILLATLVAATAWADAGPDTYAGDTTAPARDPNGGTAAQEPPAVLPSGGVPGPAMRGDAKAAQRPPGFQEEPPQVEPPPDGGEEPTPPEETQPERPGEVPDEGAGEVPAGTTAPIGVTAGGLPSTGLEIAALAAIGAGLLLAGLALRRRPA